jgi:hypothetical protein
LQSCNSGCNPATGAVGYPPGGAVRLTRPALVRGLTAPGSSIAAHRRPGYAPGKGSPAHPGGKSTQSGWEPSPSAWPFGRENPAPGVFASLRSALFLDGLSVRDAIRPSALRLGFVSPGSSIYGSFTGASLELNGASWEPRDSCRPKGRGGRKAVGGPAAAAPKPLGASNGTLCLQVGVHGGGSRRPTQWRGRQEPAPEPT